MSVLNKMLRDLEQRQQPAIAANRPGRVASISRDDKRPLWLNILLLLSAVLLLFAVYAILTRPQAIPGTLATPQERAVQSQAERVPAIEGHMEQAPPQALSQPVAAAITIEPAVAIPTTVAVAKHEAIAPDTALPLPAAGLSPVVAATAVAELPAAEQKSPAAKDVVFGQAATPAAVTVQRPAQTPQQRAESLQQQAVLAAQAGQLMPAITLWQQVQALLPQHDTAYLAQGRLWQQLGQPARAQHILQQALSNGADSADLRLLLAQFYAAAQQWPQVGHVLQPQFDLSLHPEYYGLKATAAQQTGDSIAAQHWFSQLIVLQPQQARWWLGAAVAFDHNGQQQQAQLHYRQALQWGDNLSAASRNYIQQRLAVTE